MRNEAGAWAEFRKHLPGGVMVQRIEDASGALGVADTWLGSEGRGAWVEMKFAETEGRAIKYQKGQSGFAQRCLKAGVPYVVVCGCRNGVWRIVFPKPMILLEETEDAEKWDGIDGEKVLGLLRVLGVVR